MTFLRPAICFQGDVDDDYCNATAVGFGIIDQQQRTDDDSISVVATTAQHTQPRNYYG